MSWTICTKSTYLLSSIALILINLVTFKFNQAQTHLTQITNYFLIVQKLLKQNSDYFAGMLPIICSSLLLDNGVVHILHSHPRMLQNINMVGLNSTQPRMLQKPKLLCNISKICMMLVYLDYQVIFLMTHIHQQASKIINVCSPSVLQ